MTDTYTPVLTDAQRGQLIARYIGNATPNLSADCVALCIAIERAAVEAYQRQQWQHIETAPKDGTEILLADDEGNQAVMLWDAFIRNGICGDSQGFWACPSRNLTWDHRGGFGPTKWKRLPPPPETI